MVLSEPVIQDAPVLERAHLRVVANAPWCDTLTARDACVVDLAIEDEADSQMLTTH